MTQPETKKKYGHYINSILDLQDIPETTDEKLIKLANAARSKATQNTFRNNLYIVSRVVWAITIYAVFIGLIYYEWRFLNKFLDADLKIADGDTALFVSTAWIGFVGQVIGVVVVVVKHFFPSDRE